MQPGGKDKDYTQGIRESYDPTIERIRVDALVNDGVDALVINADGSINVVVVSGGSADHVNAWISDADGFPITVGQKTMAESVPVVFPSDQAISATISSTVDTVEAGTVDTAYNEITSVPSSTLTNIVSYTAVQNTRLKIIEVSGTNIAAYTVFVNGSPIHKKRTYYGFLDNNFQFSKGYALVLGDLVQVKVEHFNTSVGDFSGFILVLKDTP